MTSLRVNEILLQEFPLNRLLTLKNRILMAPMTRANADDDYVPTDAMAAYYARRADAGLIVTEGAIISAGASGTRNVPGIFNTNQIEKWQHVTDSVHNRGGLIFLQIWHVGRVSHPDFLNGALPISCSATTMTGRIPRADGLSYGTSRAATKSEIHELIEQYATAAKNAIIAGFDGVEIHGANGYLIDQFLHFHTNHRDDEYGGSPENMARFALEVVSACGELIGYERVGLRFSPGCYLNEIVGNTADAAVFKYLFAQLSRYPIAYVHTGNFDDSRLFTELGNITMTGFIRAHYSGTVIACGGYTAQTAQLGINNQEFDLVAMGRPFIANPDFIQRIKNDENIQAFDFSLLATLH